MRKMKNRQSLDKESLELNPLWEILDATDIDIRNRTLTPKYKTGLKDLDEILWGLHKKEVMTVGARTSQGKTAFITNLIYNLADANLTIIDFTNEMTEEQMCERLITRVCEIDNINLRKGLARQDYEDQKGVFRDWCMSAKVLITNKYGRKFYTLLETCELIKPDFVILDYIQMVSAAGYGDKKQAIEDFMIGLGQLAKDMNFGAIIVSQINREGASVEDKMRPHMHQLKWSGVIEEFSDTILILHWLKEKNEFYIYVDKQRHGETGKLKVKFEPWYNKFSDYIFLPGERQIT